MPALLQLWIVIVTIGLLAIAIVTARALTGLASRTAGDLSRVTVVVTVAAEEITLATREVQALVASAQGCVTPVRSLVERFAGIGQRTATVSSVILDGIERPVFTAAAVSTGLKSAASHLLHQLFHRFVYRNASIHGDQRDE